MRSGKSVLFWAFFTTVACVSIAAADARFRLTLRVIDDEGNPVDGALARIAAGGRPNADRPSPTVFVEGMTNEFGIFSGEIRAWDASDAGYRVEKDGHYLVWLPFRAHRRTFATRWDPWNPTIPVILKRIKNPIPMYAKRFVAELPVENENVGYDLVVGDWVEPFGSGRTADILFRGWAEWQDRRNCSADLTATFPGEGNGLIPHIVERPQDTVLRMPYEAPEEGYLAQREWRIRRRYDEKAKEPIEYVGKADSTENFFIRVRAEVNERDEVVRAMYGKIHAPFDFGPSKNGLPIFSMTYFLNPDGTRNVEFDPKQNLLKSKRRRDRNFDNIGP